MNKISCIIPAYNEEPRIAAVLDIACRHSLIDEVIVIDDCSTDGTKNIISRYINEHNMKKKIRLISHEMNLGKSMSIYHGICEASGEFLFFLDADLVGLTTENVTALIKPVLDRTVDATISLRRNAPRLWHKLGIDYISGERVLCKNIFDGKLDEIPSLLRFGLEVFINQLMIYHRSKIAIIPWTNVDSPYKATKFGWYHGIKGDINMTLDIIRTIYPWGPFIQIWEMSKLVVRPDHEIKPFLNNLRSNQSEDAAGKRIIMNDNIFKISVIIPAHNEESSIAKTIEAVLAQDYPDFEVLVVNNASSDKTSLVASKYPVKVIDEPRKGLLWARECGRQNASGDVIANIDADCLPEVDWLSMGVEHFRRDIDSEIVAITGPYDYHDASYIFRNLSTLMQKYIYRPVSYVLQLSFVGGGAVLIGGNNLIRADILRKTNGYNTALTFYGEDTDTAKRITRHGRVVFDPKLAMKTSARRFHNEGTISIGIKYFYHFFKVLLKKG